MAKRRSTKRRRRSSGTTRRRSTTRRRTRRSSPRRLGTAFRASLPLAGAVGVGLLGPAAVHRFAAQQGLPRWACYAINAGTVGGGWYLLTRVKGGRYAVPFLAAGIVQLAAHAIVEHFPQVAGTLGLQQTAALPAGTMAGVQHLRGVQHLAGVQDLRAA